MKTFISILLLLLISFSSILLFGCSNDKLKKYSKLEDLRILGITSSAPEINSAQVITLTPYLSHPEGGNTTIKISYVACPDPGLAYGADVDCDDFSSPLLIEGNSTYSTSILTASEFYTGSMSDISVTIPAQAFIYLNSLSESKKFNGIDYLFIFTFYDTNNPSSKINAVKRIKLSNKDNSELNTNPSFTGNIEADGNAIENFPTSKRELKVTSFSQEESYQYKSQSGTDSFDEKYTVTWFARGGTFDFSRTDISEGNNFDPRGQSGVIVVALRDDRYGIAFKKIVSND